MTNTKISQILIASLVMLAVMLGGINLINEYVSKDAGLLGSIEDEHYKNFNSTFSKFDQMQTQINETSSQLATAEPEQGTWGVLNSLISTSWAMLRSIPTQLSFVSDWFNSMSTEWGIPMWLILTLTGFITLSILFSILGAIFQKDV
jgi:hypothetical protein